MEQDPIIQAGTSTPSEQSKTVSDGQDIYRNEEIVMWSIFGILVLGLIGAYSQAIQIAKDSWNTELYSHGYLIPFMAGALLYLRREPYQPVPQWQRWVGVALRGATLYGAYLSVYFAQEFLMQMSFVPAVAFCLLIAGGWSLFRWAGPVCFILFFMFPLYWGIERHMLEPMQEWATTSSAFLLQLFGFNAIQDGNVISINGMPLNVVGACSGLRMTTIFVALSIALILVANRAWWDNIIILLFAIPIALTVNITRITVTGIGYSFFGTGGTAEKVIHDVSGFAMVPMALLLLWGLLNLLSILFYENDSTDKNDSTHSSTEDSAVNIPE